MKIFSIVFSLASLFILVAAVPTTYDRTYDNPTGSFNSVSCSNGANGLITRYGWNVFRDVPGFDQQVGLGGAPGVTWNSPLCGSCWTLIFDPGNGQLRYTTIIAVDYAANGFNIGLNAFNRLTDGHGVEYGVVNVTSRRERPSVCGI